MEMKTVKKPKRSPRLSNLQQLAQMRTVEFVCKVFHYLSRTPNMNANTFTVPAQIMQLLGHAGLRQLLAQHRSGGPHTTLLADDDTEEHGSRPRTRAKRAKINKFPPVPSEDGRKLMDGGVFGGGQCYRGTFSKRKPRLATKLMNRELGLDYQNYTRPASRVAQVWKVEWRLSSLEVHGSDIGRVYYHPHGQTKLFITVPGATPASSLTMAIFSSRVPRILKSVCTTRRTRTTGNTIRRSFIHMGNGLLRMRH